MPYDANTNWANEEQYLNGLIAQGGGNATWAQNQLGVLNAAKAKYSVYPGNGSPINFDSKIGDFQNALDMITGLSDKASARSLAYAMQNQEWSAQQAAIARNFNAQEAAKNRNWQEYMSNTAHQREIQDLKAAGLNPVLSAMNGNGASVGSGASASASTPSGASGQSDTSMNGALVSLLGSMLSAQTQIANQLVSARTQEAVADKYTAASILTGQMAANASMYGADQSYNAHMHGIGAQFLNEKWFKENYPDNWFNVVQSIVNKMFGGSSDPYSGNGQGYLHKLAEDLYNKNDGLMSGYNKSGQGRNHQR